MAQHSKGRNLASSLLPECPVCFDVMRGARLLNCGHTYCQDCLEREVARSPAPHRVLKCPECREDMALGEDGVNGLKRNFSIQTIIDKYDNMTLSQAEDTTGQEGTELSLPEEKYIVKCKRHMNEVAYFNCETCLDTLICRVCTEGDHFRHHFVSIRGKCESLKSSLLELIEQHQRLTAKVIGRDQRVATDAIASNTRRLEDEVRQAAAKKTRAINEERDKLLQLARHIGQVLQEKTNNMYYNENPIDAIAEMVVRDNEYEIVEGYEQAMERLKVSVAEMEEKMSSRILPEVAKCLSFKEEGSRSSDTKLCDLVLSNTYWKPATTYVDIKAFGDILAFCCGPFGDWYVLASSGNNGQASGGEKSMSLRQLSSNGQCKRITTLTLKAQPLDIIFTKSGKLCIVCLLRNEVCLATVQNPSKKVTVMQPLPVKGLVYDALKVTANPQDQICVPDQNGCDVWKVNLNSGKGQKFSIDEFPHPVNAAGCGTSLYCITEEKQIIQRQEFPGSVATACNHDSKSGEPVQLLIDPKTCTLLVIHQTVRDTSNFELSIHQLGSSRPVVEPIKRNWVPSVMKVDISQNGNLAVLLAKDQNGMIVEYKRESLPLLHDIPGLLPQE